MHPATHAGISDLRAFEITAGLAAEELDVLGRLLVRRSYPRGERIIRLGDEATNLFLVTRGLVGVWLGEPADGSRVASFSAGTMVGELAFIDGERRSGTVVAEADVEGLVFAATDFLRLQETPPNSCEGLAEHQRVAGRQFATSHLLRERAAGVDALKAVHPIVSGGLAARLGPRYRARLAEAQRQPDEAGPRSALHCLCLNAQARPPLRTSPSKTVPS